MTEIKQLIELCECDVNLRAQTDSQDLARGVIGPQIRECVVRVLR